MSLEENNMPTLDGEKYTYDEKGYKKYFKALKKKRKKKPRVFKTGNSKYLQDDY